VSDPLGVLASLRDGRAPAPGQVRAFVEALVAGQLGEAHAGAFLMGVCARGLGTDAVVELTRAMLASGEILEFEVDGHLMGTDASGGSGRGTHSVRWSALCPDIVTSVEIIRDGRTVLSSSPRKDALSGEWEDRSEEAAMAGYYYLKLVQADGNTAWASPVWV